MSLHSFQSALAYVLRAFDGDNVKNIDDLAQKYALSSDEKFTLGNIIHQQSLKSYSEELHLARWTVIREGLEFLQPYIDFRSMYDLWEKNFDLKNTNIVQEDLALKFLEFLVFDPVGSAFISENKYLFMPDLMRYICSVFTFRSSRLPKLVLSPQSSLTGRYFAVLNLSYDVREFFAELADAENLEEPSLPPPPQRDITLLFVASDEVLEFRSFEIDQEVTNFLANELTGNSLKLERPACYDDLVELGIFKAEGVKRSCCSKIH